MYHAGDRFIYGIHGVCKIIGTEIKSVNKKKICYYVLQPLGQDSATYYIPANNEAALSKLRPLMTKDEVENLLTVCADISDAWISDENSRKQYYRELIVSGDRIALLKMIHALDLHKKEQLAAGRKVHQCDENFMRDAIKLLEEELSSVLEIDRSAVKDYVLEKMNRN